MLWFGGIRFDRESNSANLQTHAFTMDATELFDIVFEPMLNILLYKADGYAAMTTRLLAGAHDATGAASSAVSFFVSTESLGDSQSHCKRWPSHGACQAQGADKVARPRKHQGEAFRGWPVRLDTTHGQPRAHRGELTELGIRLRRSWGEMAKRMGRCVSPSLRDGVRAN